MAKRKKLGDILEIPLPNGRNAYGRLYKEGRLGIYKGIYQSYDEVPADAEFYRFIILYRDSCSKLKIVGSRPFSADEDSWGSDSVVVDAITGKGRLYHHGEIIACTYEECKDLEIVAAWDRHHVVDRLMGNTMWEDSLKKPKPF